jgi:hypothetical protein
VATYNLDVAFSSDVTPNNPSLPVAMAYGFTDNSQGGVFQGRGQTKDTVQPGDTVNFWVYDTASAPSYNVTSVQISVVNKSPGVGAAKSPFTDTVWANGSITAVSNPSSSQVQLSGPDVPAFSTGCNVTGKSWGIGGFTVGNFRGQKFEITVTVLTQNAQQSQKSFIVDPEVVVGSENR